MKTITVADLVAQFLSEKGVRHVYGLPGGENVAILDALRRTNIQFILTHHEAAAGFAADVTGQLTGRPGVCLSTVGPGAVNLLPTVIGATLERSPVLAITAEVDLKWQPRVTHMQLDLNRLFSPFVKSSHSLRPETAWTELNRAWQLAVSPPFGAAHLSISPDTASAAARLPPGPVDKPSLRDSGLDSLARAIPLLRSARRPWILAGIGVEMAAAQASLLNLAETWGTPVAVTPKARGHFPDDHPLYAGCFTAYGDAALRTALADADVILGAGLDGVDFVTSTWDISTPLVNLSCGGSSDPVTRPRLAIDGDLNILLAKLAASLGGLSTGEERAGQVRRAIENALDTGVEEKKGTVRLLPLIAAIRTALPDNGVVTVDVGVFKLVFLQAWRTTGPKTLFVANGLSAMGYAIPGALAVKLAMPETPVFAITGDGALHMYTGELATVARLGRPMVVLVVADQALSLIRLKQLRQNVPIYGTEFQPINFRTLAAAYDIEYRLIDSEPTAADVMSEALASPQPVLVEARVDRAEYDFFR